MERAGPALRGGFLAFAAVRRKKPAWMRGAQGLLLFAAIFCHSTANARTLPDFTPLVERYSGAVVNISATPKKGRQGRPREFTVPEVPEDSPFYDFFKKFFEQGPHSHGPARKKVSLGSGFLISADGYVITNNHVVANADEIIVRLSDRREFPASLVGTDKRSDIAVLKIAGKGLPTVKLGESAGLKVGEWVLAIGSPFGFDYSVTQGIVSAIGRSLPNENYVPFIQTDVAINPGNSGGPLFNLKGEVIGVNSQIYSRTGGFMGMSFAVPIDVVVNVYGQLRENGRVVRGWLGVLIQDVTRELAESFGMDKPHGALVAKVLPDSPAAAAGVEVGDIIVEFNGREVGFSADLPPLVGSSKVDDKASLKIIRQGKRRSLKVLIAELPEEREGADAEGDAGPEQPPPNAMNIVARDLTEAQRKRLDLPEDGVLVEKVLPGPGKEAGVRPGDVILIIDNAHVKDLEHFNRLLGALPRNRSLPLLIQRRGSPTFLAFKLSEDE